MKYVPMTVLYVVSVIVLTVIDERRLRRAAAGNECQAADYDLASATGEDEQDEL